jgi:hypothetical protein
MITKQMIDALPTASWSRADYDAHKALNQTAGKLLLVSAGHYQAYITSPHKETEALRVGILTHMCVLEPELFATNVICAPEDAPKKPTEKQRTAKKPKPETLEAIAWWQNFDESSKGKLVADRDEYALALACGTALKAELEHYGVKAAATELSLTCDYLGVPLKAQLDMVTSDGFIEDLKTFADYLNSPKKVLATVYKRGYHIQAAFYCLVFKQVFGFRPKGYRLRCVEKAAPNATQTFELSPELIAEGAVLVQQMLDTYKACKSFDSYPLYPKQVITLKPFESQKPNELDEITFA